MLYNLSCSWKFKYVFQVIFSKILFLLSCGVSDAQWSQEDNDDVILKKFRNYEI